MASPPFPTRLDVYCDTFGISLFNLCLPCVICKQVVCLSEAAEFHEKTLSVLWKNNRPHLACRSCLQALAKYERQQFYSGSIAAKDLAAQIGTPLLGIIIRCGSCLHLLSSSEKLDVLASNQPIDKVRDFYRTACKKCREKQ